MSRFSGVMTALVTPFRSGEVDYSSLLKLVRHQLDNGINGFIISGTTAESPTLTRDEKKKIFETVRGEVSGQVPLILGTGTNSTAETVESTRQAEQLGADAALVVVPYYNKPPQRGLVAHYRMVAESSGLPILLYNVPSRTISRLELDSIVELSRIANIVGIKEATGDMVFAKAIADKCGPDFLLTSGDDGTYLPFLRSGGAGIISVASHLLPKQFVEWTKRAQAGDDSVQADFDRYEKLIAHLYIEPNPIPVKAALAEMGLIERDELRLPLVRLSEEHRPRLRDLLKEVGLIA